MSECKKSVVVLMATYNGHAFVQQQVGSIAEQSIGPECIKLVLSDDNSDDNTVDIVRDCCEALNLPLLTTAPIKVGQGHLGNFSHLCEYAITELPRYEYYSFADQDDVWDHSKLELLVKECKNSSSPTLVHSDLAVVSETLEDIAVSFVAFQGLPPPGSQPLKDLLHQNVVTGCATLFNRRLLELATPVPRGAVIHDHWFALVAHYLGELRYLDQPLVSYRQHGRNSIGATSAERQRSFFSKHFYKMLFRFPFHFSQAVEQAKALEVRRLERGIDVDTENQKVVLRFAILKELPMLKRVSSVSLIFNRKKSFLEQAYLVFVLFILPLIKCKKNSIKAAQLLADNGYNMTDLYSSQHSEK